MLDKLQSSDFSPHIGQPCRLENGEAVIETVLQAIDEKPEDQRSKTMAGKRVPFILMLHAAPDCPWEGGTFTLKIEGMADMPDVYSNRILHAGPDAVFQVVFN